MLTLLYTTGLLVDCLCVYLAACPCPLRRGIEGADRDRARQVAAKGARGLDANRFDYSDKRWEAVDRTFMNFVEQSARWARAVGNCQPRSDSNRVALNDHRTATAPQLPVSALALRGAPPPPESVTLVLGGLRGAARCQPRPCDESRLVIQRRSCACCVADIRRCRVGRHPRPKLNPGSLQSLVLSTLCCPLRAPDAIADADAVSAGAGMDAVCVCCRCWHTYSSAC